MKKMIKDILDGVDVHKYTASVIYEKPESDVTKDERTAAKAHTFKPLYGGTSGTPNEVAYYQAFVDKYPALAKWHADLQTRLLHTTLLVCILGQQFAFPDTKRLLLLAGPHPTLPPSRTTLYKVWQGLRGAARTYFASQ